MKKSKYFIYLSSIIFLSYSTYAIAGGHDKKVEHKHEKGVHASETKWNINSEKTKLHFTITTKTAVTISGYFPNGSSGEFYINKNKEKSHGEFKVNLSTLKSVNKEGKENPVRDMNVTEAFFGIKNSTIAKDAVNRLWDSLSGVLNKGVQEAVFTVDNLNNFKMKDNTTAQTKIKGHFLLWGRINIPVEFPVTAEMKKNTLEITGLKPAKFNLLSVLGEKNRDTIFETMIAAGCPHEQGIENDVNVYFDKVVLVKNK